MSQIVSLLKDLWCPLIKKKLLFFLLQIALFLVFQRHCDKSWPRHFYPSESEVALLYKKAIEKYFKMSFESALLKYWPEGWQLFGKKENFSTFFCTLKAREIKKIDFAFLQRIPFLSSGEFNMCILQIYFFRQITTFIKVPTDFIFWLQTL